MKLNLCSGAHPLEGFQNLDWKDGNWQWGAPLMHRENSIEAVTISHGLTYARYDLWPFIFEDIHRVLEPGGILRITDDATDDPRSERYGGFHDHVTLTSMGLCVWHMADGFEILYVPPEFSHFRDSSLIQRWHGDPPKVFHIEGRKI